MASFTETNLIISYNLPVNSFVSASTAVKTLLLLFFHSQHLKERFMLKYVNILKSTHRHEKTCRHFSL